ncbi:hypothetical protein BN000_05803 [Mycobacterium europaeum]|uniref:MOSC domain-containing protein n=2 Tax=Mycobacterium TaxID=1763 RepID=A0ABX3TCZ4_9MYCO|nr:hypothetical protein BST46_28790 [Mycobacterium timonense]CQD23300.1 hypothetical protein BN000_05803 [Mycobacterium europaeum]
MGPYGVDANSRLKGPDGAQGFQRMRGIRDSRRGGTLNRSELLVADYELLDPGENLRVRVG